MHSYKKLAVLALAASTVSPALAAPTRESRNQARTELQERAGGKAPPAKLGGKKVEEGAKKGGVGKSLAMEFLGGMAPAALLGLAAANRRETPGQSRRATEAFERRSPASSFRPKTKPAEGAAGKGAGFGIGDKLKKAAMYGAGTAMSMAGTGVGSSIFSRGDVSPEEMAAVSNALGKRTDFTPEEAAQLQGLRLLGRELDELDALDTRDDFTPEEATQLEGLHLLGRELDEFVTLDTREDFTPEEAAQLQGLRLLGRELDELDALYTRDDFTPEEVAQLQGLRLLGRELDELDALYAREDFTPQDVAVGLRLLGAREFNEFDELD